MIDYRALAEVYVEAFRFKKWLAEIEIDLKKALELGDVDRVAVRLEKRDKLQGQYAAAIFRAHALSGCSCSAPDSEIHLQQREFVQ